MKDPVLRDKLLTRGRITRSNFENIIEIGMDDLMQLIETYKAIVVQEATKPPVDLNAWENQLQSVSDPIEKFNLFIRKWCPHYSHLIDSDDNDGEEMRQMIKALQTPVKKGK